MASLLTWDRSILDWINTEEAHPWLDSVMKFCSSEWPWFVLLAGVLLYALSQRLWKEIAIILGIGLSLGICDMIASHLIKPWVGRLRPCRVDGLVRIVDSCSGAMSFPSNHAANAAIFATMWWGLKGWRQGSVAAIFAFIIGFSRIYLGVHYPSDIIGGFIYGSFLGLTALAIGRRISSHYSPAKASAKL